LRARGTSDGSRASRFDAISKERLSPGISAGRLQRDHGQTEQGRCTTRARTNRIRKGCAPASTGSLHIFPSASPAELAWGVEARLLGGRRAKAVGLVLGSPHATMTRLGAWATHTRRGADAAPRRGLAGRKLLWCFLGSGLPTLTDRVYVSSVNAGQTALGFGHPALPLPGLGSARCASHGECGGINFLTCRDDDRSRPGPEGHACWANHAPGCS
jgi:hypothetical protein